MGLIGDLLLAIATAIVNALGALLPEGTLDLPLLDDVGAWVGESMAPFDRWFPAHETAQFLVIVTTVWMPVAGVYYVTKWIYKHLPVIGAG